jgi:hypothetical protein
MIQLQKRLVLSTEKPVYIVAASANVIAIPRTRRAHLRALTGTRFRMTVSSVKTLSRNHVCRTAQTRTYLGKCLVCFLIIW